MARESNREGPVSAAVRRVSQILDAIAASPRGVTAAELAARLKTSRQTAMRLLDSMVAAGMALRDEETKRYRLGLVLYSWGSHAVASVLPNAAVRQELVSLAAEVSPHPIFYSVLDGISAVTLERTQVLDGTAITTPLNSRLHWPERPIGIAMAAFTDQETTQRLLDAPGPANNGAEAADLPAVLKTTRERGYAELLFAPDRASFAAPVLDDSGYAAAAIGMGVNNYSPEDHERLLAALRQSALRCSNHLGYGVFMSAP